MVDRDKREAIAEINPEALVFDNPAFDNSIIGVTTDGQVVYDLDEMIIEFAIGDPDDVDIAEEDARAFIEYNTLRALPYMGENAPVIVQRLYV